MKKEKKWFKSVENFCYITAFFAFAIGIALCIYSLMFVYLFNFAIVLFLYVIGVAFCSIIKEWVKTFLKHRMYKKLRGFGDKK